MTMAMTMKHAPLAAVMGLLGGALMAPAQADTDTQSFNVNLTVTSTCDIHTVAATDVKFGSRKSTEGTVTAEGKLTVNCTNGTPYQIGLDNGANYAGGSRNMKSAAGDTVAYTLWQDAGWTQSWGNTQDTDTLQRVGTGAAQDFAVYGQAALSSQNLKAASYEDVVTATVTY